MRDSCQSNKKMAPLIPWHDARLKKSRSVVETDGVQWSEWMFESLATGKLNTEPINDAGGN
jgi:hypothetical protein